MKFVPHWRVILHSLVSWRHARKYVVHWMCAPITAGQKVYCICWSWNRRSSCKDPKLVFNCWTQCCVAIWFASCQFLCPRWISICGNFTPSLLPAFCRALLSIGKTSELWRYLTNLYIMYCIYNSTFLLFLVDKPIYCCVHISTKEQFNRCQRCQYWEGDSNFVADLAWDFK